MVEGARLESVYAGDRIAGSNPVLSAIHRKLSLNAIYSVVNKKQYAIRGKFILFMLVVKKTYKKS
ncbi:MAG: hypothetical protein JWM00_101 [Candidatus Saccharibacteria bacterium]|nr:hypothetical protein [Candidatus Saccharibacteria bacterium]